MLSTLRFNVCSASKGAAVDKEEAEPLAVASSIYTQSSSPKDMGYDYTKYALNGSYPLGKNEFVLAVVKEYIKQHPEKTYKELEDIFKPQFQLGGNRIDSTKGSNGPGVIRPLAIIEQKRQENRYHKEVLFSSDKVPFKVCTQWGIGNIGNIVELAKRLGYEVKTV